MSGRGDNNKNGSSGRGASNQSNQPFGSNPDMGKSNTGRSQKEGQASRPQEKSLDQSSNRNRSTKGDKS
ncbi:MAG TPA: hypothetical protein VHK69_20805 [Chitinophagaceae bacterium]|jgi:hypothetical protein|nr:hypothetical protein [Chitinophagaceae bacterium]